ncbi:MAG: XRE family transcriptional regulator [Oscillospiraceae bacterium]|nr:XRE family transcriptional regulator [Oscillospiraceae bacterium]
MEIDIREIAARVRGLRELMEISTAEMAEKLEIDEKDYCARESGERDFSVTFLSKCASVFGVDLIELMTGEQPKLSFYTLVRAGKGLPLERRSGFKYQHLAPVFKDKKMEPFLVVAPYKPEEQTKPIELSTHRGQEMDYILSGQLKVVLGGKTELLEAGDTIYYDSENKHGMIATGGSDCTFLAILYSEKE